MRYFEEVSLVEGALRRDPAGVYNRMDFLSRDQQRHAVEQIAAPTGEAQVQLALKAVECARDAATKSSVSDRAAHVGYHLIGPGRADFEVDVAYRPPFAARLRDFTRRHPTLIYLGSIAAIAASLILAAVWWVTRFDAGVFTLAVTAGLLIVPMLDLAIAFVHRVSAWAVAPRRLCRLELTDGVPDDARTMVIVPTLLTREEDVAPLLEHLEVLACGNALEQYVTQRSKET